MKSKCAPRIKRESDLGEKKDVIVKLLNQTFKLKKINIHSDALGWSQECFETDI